MYEKGTRVLVRNDLTRACTSSIGIRSRYKEIRGKRYMLGEKHVQDQFWLTPSGNKEYCT